MTAIISLVSLIMIYPDIVPTVFCVQFWIGHYRMKKQQFEMSQQEIEQEKKLGAIVDQKGQAVVYAKMPIEIGVYRQRMRRYCLTRFRSSASSTRFTTPQKAGWYADTSRPL
jgi:hypothetical protein